MFWWANSEQRKRILARFRIDRRIIQDALADLYAKVFRTPGNRDPFVEEILILAERRLRMRDENGDLVAMDYVLEKASLGAA